MKNVSIIGLGKLGSCMAAVYANKGYNTIGVDLNKNFVNAINNHQAPVPEPGLDELIKDNAKNLKATHNYDEAVLNSDITFIIVPTPTDETGGFTNKYVVDACKQIASALAKKIDYHLVVLTSTVLPQSCEQEIIPALEQYSGKKCGKNFGFCYSPLFIAIGTVINDLLYPDFYLIGQSDKKSGKLLKEFYSQINSSIPVHLMNIVSAELTKITLNAYITMKISFSNILAEICENIPNADVDKITDAIGSDKRVGEKYLKSGLGFGGPCFPRDNVAFAYMANKHNADAPLAKITHDYNEKMVDRIAKIIQNNILPGQKIGFLGLSYKPGTPLVEESHALKILKKLLEQNFQIAVYEPAGYKYAKRELEDKVKYCDNLIDCLESSDVYFISNMEKEFEFVKHFVQNKNNKTIFDPWRILKNNNFSDSIKYITLGIGK